MNEILKDFVPVVFVVIVVVEVVVEVVVAIVVEVVAVVDAAKVAFPPPIVVIVE